MNWNLEKSYSNILIAETRNLILNSSKINLIGKSWGKYKYRPWPQDQTKWRDFIEPLEATVYESIEEGQIYTLSFKASNPSLLEIYINGEQVVDFIDESNIYRIFQAKDSGILTLKSRIGMRKVEELKLELDGNIAPQWTPAPEDFRNADIDVDGFYFIESDSLNGFVDYDVPYQKGFQTVRASIRNFGDTDVKITFSSGDTYLVEAGAAREIVGPIDPTESGITILNFQHEGILEVLIKKPVTRRLHNKLINKFYTKVSTQFDEGVEWEDSLAFISGGAIRPHFNETILVKGQPVSLRDDNIITITSVEEPTDVDFGVGDQWHKEYE